MTITDQIEILNDLVSKSKDAENGYKEAAQHAQSETLKKNFVEYSQQRFAFRHELSLLVNKLGGSNEKGTSVAADIHQAWIELKTAISSNEDQAILKEVLRGESYALEAYEEALKNLPVTAAYYSKIVDQRNTVRAAIQRMKTLEVISQA